MTAEHADRVVDQPCLGFVGVSTGSSSIRTIFPRWAAELALPASVLVGHDVALDAAPSVYRQVVEEIRDSRYEVGALVTTHKMAIHRAAADLFDELDEAAELFGEISCIAKRDGRLIGSAKDPLTARLALEDFLPEQHFTRRGSDALVLGQGGAGTALSYQLARRSDRPGKIICTDRSADALDHARRIHRRAGIPEDLMRYIVTDDAETAGRVLESLPSGSLVVNATGMGKDRPGSPVPDQALLPPESYIWEFNYRGELDFLRQARRQQDRKLIIEDGWRYFIHGWTQVIAEVFDIAMPASTVEQLSGIAAGLRR